MLFLLFHDDATCLGEITTREGALGRLVLSEAGEATIGSEVEQWLTEQWPRSSAFVDRFSLWAVDSGLRLIALPTELVPSWELLASAPLESPERYAFLIELIALPKEEHPAWRERVEKTKAKPAKSAKKKTAPKKKKALR